MDEKQRLLDEWGYRAEDAWEETEDNLTEVLKEQGFDDEVLHLFMYKAAKDAYDRYPDKTYLQATKAAIEEKARWLIHRIEDDIELRYTEAAKEASVRRTAMEYRGSYVAWAAYWALAVDCVLHSAIQLALALSQGSLPMEKEELADILASAYLEHTGETARVKEKWRAEAEEVIFD